MNLDRNKRIILFVVLIIIYFLFFNVFTFKVNALVNDMSNIDYYYYRNGNKNNATQFVVTNDNVTTIPLFDMNFHTSSDNVTKENYFYEMSSQNKSGNSYPVKYFSFVFYTLENIPEPEFSILGFNYKDYCNVLDTIENQDINFYISTCSLPEVYNVGLIEAYFNQSTPVLSNSNHYAFSDLYSFDTEAELIDFITQKQTEINKTIEDGNIKDIVDNIFTFITDGTVDTNSTNSYLEGFSNSLNGRMSDTPVSGLVTLPISFLTAVSNSMVGQCSAVNYFQLFDYTLMLPCPRLDLRLGSVWNIIDTIFSLMLIYSIGKSLVRTFARLSDMDTNIMYECYSEGMKIRGRRDD